MPVVDFNQGKAHTAYHSSGCTGRSVWRRRSGASVIYLAHSGEILNVRLTFPLKYITIKTEQMFGKEKRMEEDGDGRDLMEKLELVRRMDPGAVATIERIVDDLLKVTDQEARAITALYIAEIQKTKNNTEI
jgi:hypothetical protein